MALFRNSFYVLLGSLLTITTKGNIHLDTYVRIGKVGPFEIDLENALRSRIDFYHLLTTPYLETFNVYETATLKNINGTKIVSYAKGVHAATITEYDCIWQLPIHKYLDERGLIINLDVRKDSNDSVIFEKEFTIYPINNKVFNPFLTNNRTYACKNYAYERTIDEDNYYSASYDFSNLLDYTEGRVSRYLEYPSCSFKYDSLDDFSYEDAYIKFYDKHHLFEKYRTSSDGYKHIPLILDFIKDEKKVNVSTKHGYYLNEDTMEISDIYRSGFRYTEKFVLPYNFSTFEEDYEFSVEMIDIGGDKLDVIFPLGFGGNNNYFGLCSNSENCVIGGIVE